jgi:hypothetical protein
MELFYLENDLPGSAKARKPAFSPPFISLNARAGHSFSSSIVPFHLCCTPQSS